MGVLACDRKGCENIMCDYLSHEHGYLCNECREELIRTGPQNIRGFMLTDKVTHESSDHWENLVLNTFEPRN